MRIKDICSGVTDGSHNPPQGLENSDYLMLSSKNVFDDKITFDSPRYLSQIDFEQESKRTRIKSGDVLLTIVGTVGRAAVVGENMPQFTLQRSVAVLHPNVEICDSRYLMYALQANRNHIESRAKGVAQKGIYLKEVADIELQIPVLSEQTHRVKVLDKIAFVIKFRQQQLQKLDELVKARFVELFGEPKINPHNYPACQLSEHISFLTSGSRGWAQYCTDNGSEWFITIKNVKDCHVSTDNMQPIDAPDNAEAKRTKVQEGDLLISITADLGRTGVVTKEIAEHGAYINQHLTCIRLNKTVLNPLYVAYFMESPAGKEQFELKNQSAVKAGLNFNSIKSLRVMIPPISEQNVFVAFLNQVDKSKLQVPSGNALCIRYPIFIEMMFLRGV